MTRSLLGQSLVTEMTFQTPAANGVGATVPMDVYPAAAAGQMVLKGNGSYNTEIVTNATGLGKRWIAPLRQGYLTVDYFANTNERDKMGATTTDQFWRYTGASSGSGNIAMTVYMVIQPNQRWNDGNGRRTIFGTGHTYDGYVRLWYQNQVLRYQFGDNINKVTRICELTLSNEWNPASWYFVAASWAKDETPILYVREMTREGVNSPAAILGVLTEGDTFQAVPPPGKNRNPSMTPLGIGCYYYNPGNGAGTIDGLDGKVNYLRIDSGMSSVEQMEGVFNSLVAPDEETVLMIR